MIDFRKILVKVPLLIVGLIFILAMFNVPKVHAQTTGVVNITVQIRRPDEQSLSNSSLASVPKKNAMINLNVNNLNYGVVGAKDFSITQDDNTVNDSMIQIDSSNDGDFSGSSP